MVKEESNSGGSPLMAKNFIPAAPPLPNPARRRNYGRGLEMDIAGWKFRGYSWVNSATRDLGERLFDEGCKADVNVISDNGGTIVAHANVLGMASPVMKDMLKKSKGQNCRRSISIKGVPHDAVRVFIRFLYSPCYEKEEMEELEVQLLVLSHAFVVPRLKQLCERQLEQRLVSTENVVDIFQLALLCDTPRLSLICHRIIVNNFKAVSATQGWKAMKQSHPRLEKQLLESVMDEDLRQKVKIKKAKEKKIYLQLYEAMEAVVHICREGCRTIGPRDKDLRENKEPCKYEACKGLELLVRHFAGCKLREAGKCLHCKRMWQLLELHSRICADSALCRVPLCRNFKERMKKQSKQEEIKWKILVKKIMRTKSIGGAPYFSSEIATS